MTFLKMLLLRGRHNIFSKLDTALLPTSAQQLSKANIAHFKIRHGIFLKSTQCILKVDTAFSKFDTAYFSKSLPRCSTVDAALFPKSLQHFSKLDSAFFDRRCNIFQKSKDLFLRVDAAMFHSLQRVPKVTPAFFKMAHQHFSKAGTTRSNIAASSFACRRSAARTS